MCQKPRIVGAVVNRPSCTKLTEIGEIIETEIIALKSAQEAFAGEAERLGIKDEQDVVAMVKEVRREIREEIHAGDA